MLSQSQGWLDIGRQQREAGPPEPDRPHRQPRRVLLLLVLLDPGSTSRAPALIGTGRLPRSPDPGPLCARRCAVGRCSFSPAPVSPVPDLSVQTVCVQGSCTISFLCPVNGAKNSPNTGTRCRPWADNVSHPFQVGLVKQLLGLNWT